MRKKDKERKGCGMTDIDTEYELYLEYCIAKDAWDAAWDASWEAGGAAWEATEAWQDYIEEEDDLYDG